MLTFLSRDIKPDNILLDLNGKLQSSRWFGQIIIFITQKRIPQDFPENMTVTRCLFLTGTHISFLAFSGHFHLTDFNIAAVLEETHLATSMSGTKPYIAPEIFDCAMDLCVGYSYPVDWWSLGKRNIELSLLCHKTRFFQESVRMRCSEAWGPSTSIQTRAYMTLESFSRWVWTIHPLGATV